MRVLFAADDLYPGFGGIAASTQGHADALRRRGHAVRALAGRDPKGVAPPEGVGLERLPSVRLGALQTRLALPWPATMQRALRWAEVVHVNAPTPFGAALVTMARARGIPTVMGVHVQVETAALQAPVGGAALGAALRAWYGAVFRLSDARVAPTAFAARMAADWTGRPVHVISNGLPPGRPAPGRDEARRTLPTDWWSEGDGPLLVYLGRLSPEKRPGDLLELVRALPVRARLVLAGEGPLHERLQRRIDAGGLGDRAVLAGFVDDARLPSLLAAADLFLMPSPAELQSIASLEAMAYGCPVAAADHASSAVPEWVAASGGGIVYPHGDPERAAAAVAALLTDASRTRDAREAARRHAARHDVDAAAAELEALYAALARGAVPAGAILPA